MVERNPVFEEFMVDLQKLLRRVLAERSAEGYLGDFDLVAAVDVAYRGELAAAAAAVWSLGSGGIVEERYLICEAPYPYVPGLLFLREAPPMLKVLKALRSSWDLLLVDGHGILHPRGMGLAVFLGLLLEKPALGVAKSLLVGSESGGGEFGEVRVSGEVSGYWFKLGGRKFYASPGYMIRVDQVPAIVKRLGGYPKPLSYADKLSRKVLASVGGRSPRRL